MLSLILSLKALLQSSILIRIGAYAVAGLISWGLIWFAGYNSGKEVMETRYRENQARLERAVADYKNRLEDSLVLVEKEQNKLDELLEKLDNEADADPNSTNLCIGPDGVRRLNQGFGYR